MSTAQRRRRLSAVVFQQPAKSVTPYAGVPGRAGAETSPVSQELFEQVTSVEEAALDRKAKAEAFQASGGVMASQI